MNRITLLVFSFLTLCFATFHYAGYRAIRARNMAEIHFHIIHNLPPNPYTIWQRWTYAVVEFPVFAFCNTRSLLRYPQAKERLHALNAIVWGMTASLAALLFLGQFHIPWLNSPARSPDAQSQSLASTLWSRVEWRPFPVFLDRANFVLRTLVYMSAFVLVREVFNTLFGLNHIAEPHSAVLLARFICLWSCTLLWLPFAAIPRFQHMGFDPWCCLFFLVPKISLLCLPALLILPPTRKRAGGRSTVGKAQNRDPVRLALP